MKKKIAKEFLKNYCDMWQSENHWKATVGLYSFFSFQNKNKSINLNLKRNLNTIYFNNVVIMDIPFRKKAFS